MPRTLFNSQNAPILSGSALDLAAAIGWESMKAENTTFVVVFSAGTSAGAVVIEGAHRKDFTGTWANLATIAWSAANKAHVFNVSGNHLAIRARISVAVVGGIAEVYANITG